MKYEAVDKHLRNNIEDKVDGMKLDMKIKIPQSGVYFKPVVMLTLSYPYLFYT